MFNLLRNFQGRSNKVWKRRKLFHATDFHSLMYPCFTLSRILGTFPYKINASVFEASKWRYVVLTIITCAVCVTVLAKIYKMNILGSRSTAFDKIQDICFNVFQSFIIIASSILSGPRMCLLQTMLEVSSKLPPKSYEKLSKIIHAKDIFGFLFLMGFSVLLVSNFLSSRQENEDVIFLCTISLMECYTDFQILQTNMLYINCVCLLKACFKRIDDNLTNLRELMINDKPHLPRLIYYQQSNPLLLKELKTLEKQYSMISDTVKMLNTTFSPQLLATFGILFIEITFELYYQWQNGSSINLIIQFRNTVLISYILYYIIKMILIVWACETGKNQATKINITVHEVLNSTSDKQIKNELHSFSLQILHRDNTFSAKGFIVDARLLPAMMGTITTYILILIQFSRTSLSCDGKPTINVTQAK